MTTQSPTEQRSSSPSIRPASGSEAYAAAAVRLRAELDATTDAGARAVFLHESGVLLEKAGDDPGAARDYLAAFNAEPMFREPLEALVALLHRRRSVKNLGKLLEALVRAAATTDEASRALVERASFLTEQQADLAGAKQALREAVSENPDELTGWLELEILAGKESDKAARLEALAERAARAEPPTWRALLMLDVADMEAQAGDREKAAATCRAAAVLEGAARFRAYVLLGDLARREQDDSLLAEALEAQAELVLGALEDGAAGDAEGVPVYVRTAHFVADALLRAADARRRSGELAGAAALLERAASRLPGELTVLYAQLSVADASGNIEKSAGFARKLLEAGVTGPEAASLWMQIWREADDEGKRDEAVAALTAAVTADPACVPARALQLDFLSLRQGEQDGALLASSLEAAAEQMTSEPAKAKLYLRAAWEWATRANDDAAAKTALSMAGSLGVPAGTLSRVARTLAALTNDGTWYDEATRRVILAGASEGEVPGLWFEIVRGRLLRGEWEPAQKALDSLVAAPGGAWLGRVLSAYAMALPRANAAPGEDPPARSAAALDALAQVESEPSLARALQVLAAMRAQAAGDRAGAKERLGELLRGDASDVVASAFLVQLLREDKDLAGAAATLQATAAAVDDRQLSAALSLEAALLLWGNSDSSGNPAGARASALEPMRAARGASPQAAGPLLLWATRGIEPDSVDARRQALELAGEAGVSPALLALERLGLELSAGDQDEARAALESLERESEGELRLAAALARVAWPTVADREPLDNALSLLAAASDAGVSLSAAEQMRIARDIDQDKADYARHAASWAEADPSAETALEWLASAVATDDTATEAHAHALLSQSFSGDASASLEAEAVLVQWLTQGGPAPDLLPLTLPSAQLLNLELAPAGCDPRRRASALRGLGSALGAATSVDALALSGWSDLASGEPLTALETFRRVVERRPTDIAGWEGLRTAARQLADGNTRAFATAKLGELCKDNARAGAFWEEAGMIWLEEVNDEAHGELALTNAFARDPRRAVAFDKLFRRVRARQDDDRLLELAARRLEVADDDTEIVKLYWEQARVLRKKGDLAAALEALTNVTLLEPDHVGALALSGDVFIKTGMFEEAAEALSKLSTLDEAPAQQRLTAGIGAVEIYEKRLGNVKEALQVLIGLHKAGLSTSPVRERLAGLAAKAGAWPEATAMFEVLMLDRESAEGRIQAARLAMAIWRDKVSDPKSAKNAVIRLLEESPGDGEALDLVLSTDFSAQMKALTLGAGKSALVQALQKGPLDPDMVSRLGKIARATDDPALVQAALGALAALGRETPALAGELEQLDHRAAKVPQIQIDQKALAAIGDPADTGPVVRLFEVLGEVIAEALGPTKDTLGVGRRERVDPRSGLPLRNDIAAWAGALGLGEFELYVGGKDPNLIQGVGGEVPVLVVGAGVHTPLSAAARSSIARELFALRRGITVVRTRDEATVGSIVVAACNLVDVQIDAPQFAILGDVQRQLGKAMSRKVKKLLPEICQQVAASRPDVRGWARAVQRSLDRMATIAAGDAAIVLEDLLGCPRAELKRQVSGNERAERLLRFVLSPQYLELRTRLGMGVR
jgi:cellulose synthase operon protein C